MSVRGGCAIAFIGLFVAIGVVAVVADPTGASGTFGYCWLITLAAVLIGMYVAERHSAKLRADGVPAWADIVAAEETGVQINDRPVVRLTLRVHPPDGDAYQAESRETVPLTALGRLSDGRPVRLYLDPRDRNRFVIDWSESSAGEQQPASASPGSRQVAQPTADPASRMRQLDQLRSDGLISEAEYAEHRARILGEL